MDHYTIAAAISGIAGGYAIKSLRVRHMVALYRRTIFERDATITDLIREVAEKDCIIELQGTTIDRLKPDAELGRKRRLAVAKQVAKERAQRASAALSQAA